MLSNTVDAIKSVLAIDPTLTDDTRREVVEMVRGVGSGAKREAAPAPAVCVVYEEAARRLGCSKDMVRYLRRRGKLVGVSYTGRNCHGVTEESLNALINAGRPAQGAA